MSCRSGIPVVLTSFDRLAISDSTEPFCNFNRLVEIVCLNNECLLSIITMSLLPIVLAQVALFRPVDKYYALLLVSRILIISSLLHFVRHLFALYGISSSTLVLLI